MTVMLIAFCTNASAAEKIFLGVLEPYPDNSWEKEVESDWVRLPFFWDGKSWSAMPRGAENTNEVAALYPGKLTLYAGRLDADGGLVYNAINVSTAKYYADISGSAPSYKIKEIDPSIINYMAQDENFCHANGICKTPMILTNTKTVKADSEGWEEVAELPAAERKLAYETFKKEVPTFKDCVNEGDKGVPKKWRESQVNLIRAYHSKKDEVIVGLQLSKDFNTCYDAYDPAFAMYWFYLKDQQAVNLGKEIMPVEYADYNGNGSTEWLFAIYGEDREGYILFSDNFKTKLTYDWAYH